MCLNLNTGGFSSLPPPTPNSMNSTHWKSKIFFFLEEHKPGSHFPFAKEMLSIPVTRTFFFFETVGKHGRNFLRHIETTFPSLNFSALKEKLGKEVFPEKYFCSQ